MSVKVLPEFKLKSDRPAAHAVHQVSRQVMSELHKYLLERNRNRIIREEDVCQTISQKFEDEFSQKAAYYLCQVALENLKLDHQTALKDNSQVITIPIPKSRFVETSKLTPDEIVQIVTKNKLTNDNICDNFYVRDIMKGKKQDDANISYVQCQYSRKKNPLREEEFTKELIINDCVKNSEFRGYDEQYIHPSVSPLRKHCEKAVKNKLSCPEINKLCNNLHGWIEVNSGLSQACKYHQSRCDIDSKYEVSSSSRPSLREIQFSDDKFIDTGKSFKVDIINQKDAFLRRISKRKDTFNHLNRINSDNILRVDQIRISLPVDPSMNFAGSLTYQPQSYLAFNDIHHMMGGIWF